MPISGGGGGTARALVNYYSASFSATFGNTLPFFTLSRKTSGGNYIARLEAGYIRYDTLTPFTLHVVDGANPTLGYDIAPGAGTIPVATQNVIGLYMDEITFDPPTGAFSCIIRWVTVNI